MTGGATGPGSGPSGRQGPHAFVADLEQPVLDDEDRRHLERVLRTRVGDGLTVSDGRGRWREAVLGADGGLEPIGAIAVVARPAPAITIAFALVKGERPELVVQKLTELGADEVVPFVAERSVVRWDEDKAARNQARPRSVARQAAMQSRRCWLPTVRPLATFAEVAALPGSVAADRDGEPPSLEHPTVLVGPEGGWSPAERERLPARVRLGDLVLRAETAAIVASATLSQLRAGLVMVAPSGHRCPEPG